MPFKPRLVIMLIGLAALGETAIAQTPVKIPVYRLEPRVVADIPDGKAVLVSGKVGATPHRFFVENLHMLVPVLVTVRPGNPDDVINVKVSKWRWDEPLREGATSGGNQVSFRFRTQGEFQVSLDAAKADSPYKMLVWLGKDIKSKSTPVIVPKSQYNDGKTNWLLWLSVAAAVGLVAVLSFFYFKRRQPQ